MDKNSIWQKIEENVQRVAEQGELVQPGQTFALTRHQEYAIAEVGSRLTEGKDRILLKAPTGSGKTEVSLRVAVQRALDTGRHVVMLAPTRDLARQQHMYFADRLAETGLECVQMHAGIPPRDRQRSLDQLLAGNVSFAIGSAMLLQQRKYRSLLETASLVIVDDVNAFDEDEDLAHLRGLAAPVLFTSATPEAVERFLKREGAWRETVAMTDMPFDSPPTRRHEVPASWNENIFTQIDLGMEVLRRHIESGSRIYVISRTRARVPILARYIEDRVGVPVSMLHGEMADSLEHRRRSRGKSADMPLEDRVSMMRQFRDNKPAILVATNLVGSGLDIPMADMVLVTDADHFGEAEIEQLVGRVGRRERESDCVLITGTTTSYTQNSPKIKQFTYIRNGKVIQSFKALPPGRRRMDRRRAI
jgi:RecG-like helicase